MFTWGKGDYHRLGHGSDDHVRRPRKVAALQGRRVISIATGSLHCVACTDGGEVFTWGDNDEGQVIIPYPVQRNTVSAQLGDGTTNAIQRPRLVGSLQNRKINRVACGSGNDSISGHSLILFRPAHTLAWSTSEPVSTSKLPAAIPLECDLLR